MRTKTSLLRGFCLTLALALILGLCPVPPASAAGYDAAAAVAYARANYNGKEDYPGNDCANFVSKCLQAGGVNVQQTVVSSLRNALINGGYGSSYLLAKSGVYVKLSQNQGKVAVGDPIFLYCPTCKAWSHTVLCTGVSNGNILISGHSAAQLDDPYIGSAYHYKSGVKHDDLQVYSVHMNGSGSGTVTPPSSTGTASFSIPTDSDYTSKFFVTVDNACLVTQVNKSSGLSCTWIGLELYNTSGTRIARKGMNVTNVSASNTRFHTWYDLKSELGITLSPGTTYYYRFVGTFGGKEYTGNTYAFATTPSAPSSTSYSYIKCARTVTIPAGYYLPCYSSVTKNNQAQSILPKSSAYTVTCANYVQRADGTLRYPVVIDGTTYYFDPSAAMTVSVQHTAGPYTYWEDAHPHKGYKLCGCGEKLYTGETSTVEGCAQCAAENPPEPVYCTVVFDPNGGTGGTQREVLSGEAVGSLPEPQREGYDFLGWYTSPTGGIVITRDTVVKEDVTYYAHWEELPLEEQELSPSMDHFSPDRRYSGQFRDVYTYSWFYDAVSSAYSYQLIDGVSTDSFDPDGSLTIAQTLKLAAVIHRLYCAGVQDFDQSEGSYWYDCYVNYARDNGIPIPRSNYDAVASRYEVAQILSAALPEAELPAINRVPDGAIPDVSMTAGYAPAVYLLYRAGILTGSDDQGSFEPYSAIKRSEIAAIVSRMVDVSQRKSLSLA